MKGIDAPRWAEALLGAAGKDADAALDAFAALVPAAQASGSSFRRPSARSAELRLTALFDSLELEGGQAAAARLLVLLARQGRLAEAGAVLDAARALRAEKSGTLLALAETAEPLDDELRSQLSAALKARSGAADVKLEEKTDPSLLGGARVTVGYERIDGTLKRRLESLASALGGPRGGNAW